MFTAFDMSEAKDDHPQSTSYICIYCYDEISILNNDLDYSIDMHVQEQSHLRVEEEFRLRSDPVSSGDRNQLLSKFENNGRVINSEAVVRIQQNKSLQSNSISSPLPAKIQTSVWITASENGGNYCILCDVSLPGPSQYTSHLEGRRHGFMVSEVMKLRTTKTKFRKSVETSHSNALASNQISVEAECSSTWVINKTSSNAIARTPAYQLSTETRNSNLPASNQLSVTAENSNMQTINKNNLMIPKHPLNQLSAETKENSEWIVTSKSTYGEYYCTLCDCFLWSENQYDDHIRQLKHRLFTAIQPVVVSFHDDRVSFLSSDLHDEYVFSVFKKLWALDRDWFTSRLENELFRCDVCDCFISLYSSYKNHINSRTHLKKLDHKVFCQVVRGCRGKTYISLDGTDYCVWCCIELPKLPDIKHPVDDRPDYRNENRNYYRVTSVVLGIVVVFLLLRLRVTDWKCIHPSSIPRSVVSRLFNDLKRTVS